MCNKRDNIGKYNHTEWVDLVRLGTIEKDEVAHDEAE
ncbi:hypothetical protein SPX_42840 [Sporomusa paucivorans]|jgi:hypothetical protein